MSNFARQLVLLIACAIVGSFLAPHVGAQTSYIVDVSVSGLPATLSTNIYVDGTFNTTMTGGQSITFTFNITTNPHSITVDYYVPNSLGLNGSRYFVQDPTWTFSAPGHHIFTYVAQYFLTVTTPYSSATGQGWYTSGTKVNAVLKDREIIEGQGTRHVFSGWSRDAFGGELTSNDITMTGPMLAVASWKTQFYLTVESDPPNITDINGTGWYDSQSDAQFSAPAFVPASTNTRLRFDHWSGDYTGETTHASVFMDRPKNVKAAYLAQYLLTIQYNPSTISSQYNESHAGWYDANSNVQLGPVPSIINLSSAERLRFTAWVAGGSQSSAPSYTMTMDQPHTITLLYVTQYYVDVRSSQGSATGSGWYDKGSTANITATVGQEAWPLSYTLTGWNVDPSSGSMVKTDDSWQLTVDKPYVVEAQWTFDFLPLVLIFGGGAVAVTVIAAGAVLARRRGTFTLRTTPPAIPKDTHTFPTPATPPVTTQLCPSCGKSVANTATFCDKCGAPIEATPSPQPLADDRVYDYIVKHEGVISLHTAAAELGIAVEELKEITERLKKQGRLT